MDARWIKGRAGALLLVFVAETVLAAPDQGPRSLNKLEAGRAVHVTMKTKEGFDAIWAPAAGRVRIGLGACRLRRRILRTATGPLHVGGCSPLTGISSGFRSSVRIGALTLVNHAN
jgi:hypothetical protein